jgi:hypothetical protein
MERPQLALIAKHLLERGDISALEAATSYKVRSLSRRIVDLKKAGYRIRTSRNKDGSGQEYVRYHLDLPRLARRSDG